MIVTELQGLIRSYERAIIGDKVWQEQLRNLHTSLQPVNKLIRKYNYFFCYYYCNSAFFHIFKCVSLRMDLSSFISFIFYISFYNNFIYIGMTIKLTKREKAFLKFF